MLIADCRLPIADADADCLIEHRLPANQQSTIRNHHSAFSIHHSAISVLP
jgi:hypothetical protein